MTQTQGTSLSKIRYHYTPKPLHIDDIFTDGKSICILMQQRRNFDILLANYDFKSLTMLWSMNKYDVQDIESDYDDDGFR